MDTKKVLLALVAVVVVAGIAFVVLNGGDSEDGPVGTQTALPVYGNANNDDFVNEADIDKIKEIMEGSWDKTKFAYADANHDGAVSDDDVKFVQDMIDRKDMTIWYTNSNGVDANIDVPVYSMFVTGYEAMYGLQVLNKHTDVVGRDDMKSASMRDETLNKTIYDKAAPIAKTPFNLDMGLVTEVIEKNKADGKKVNLLVTSGTYCEKQQDLLEQLGVKTIRTAFMDLEKANSSILTLGYFLDAEDLAHDYVKFMEDFRTDVEQKVASLPAEQKEVKSLLNVFGSWLFSSATEDSQVMEMAGCKNALIPAMIDGAEMKETSKGEAWYLGPEFNVPFMVVKGAFTYGNTVDDYASVWDKGIEGCAWDKMMPDHYKDGIVIVNYMVTPVMMISYIAEFMHEDAFGAGYTDGKHQELIDRFLPDLKAQDYIVADHPFSLSYEDLKDHVKFH